MAAARKTRRSVTTRLLTLDIHLGPTLEKLSSCGRGERTPACSAEWPLDAEAPWAAGVGLRADAAQECVCQLYQSGNVRLFLRRPLPGQDFADLASQSFPGEWLGEKVHAGIQYAMVTDGVLGVAG